MYRHGRRLPGARFQFSGPSCIGRTNLEGTLIVESQSYFPPEEFQDRRRRVRKAMSEEGVETLLISTPENIYYLTGLDHMGYFATQMLILPLRGKPILVTRKMEAATVADQVPDLIHYGYADGSRPIPLSETDSGEGGDAPGGAVDMTSDLGANLFMEPSLRGQNAKKNYSAPVAEICRAVSEGGYANTNLALEEGGSFLTYRVASNIKEGLPDGKWTDGTGIVDRCRRILSPLEISCTKQAAIISDSMIQAGMAAAGENVSQREVMAAIYDAMFRRGGTYPGFVPLVRSTSSLVHEHGTWEDTVLRREDMLFLEMSGCVRRYHAPMGRLVFIGKAPKQAYQAHDICHEALMAAADTIGPDVMAGDVYEAWQSVLNRNELSSYRRHHCGYNVGIGYPPSWSGGDVPVGLRPESELRLQAGMVFHLMSWLLRSDYGDSFLSDTIIVTDDGCELLTSTIREVFVRK